MKTTKNLFKTLLISLMLVSCLGANAMAEEKEPGTGNTEVAMTLNSTFTWDIPPRIDIEKSDLKNADVYEKNFDVSINSVTIGRNEEVQVTIKKEMSGHYTSSGNRFYMVDMSDLENMNNIYYYIRETGNEDNIGLNEVLLSATAERFSTNSDPVTKTLRIVIPCGPSMSYSGTYKSIIVFEAQTVNKAA